MQKFEKMRTMRSRTFNKRLSNRDRLSNMRQLRKQAFDLKFSMRRKSDEEAQIEHHMKKQIDSARRNVA